MYTVILAAALTAGGSSQQWCHGCYGGSSWGWGTFNYCSGGFGCSGYGCYGCGCYGCGGCYGGWGYGYGSYGVWTAPAAYAMYGTYWYCSGGYGYAPYIGCVGCYGCYGGWSGYGPAVNVAPSTTTVAPVAPVAPANPAVPARPRIDQQPIPKATEKSSSLSGPRSTVVVEVPQDAKVYIDGKLMTSTSTRRVYHTPVLEAGEIYFYDVRVELVREGRTVSQSRRVILNPGQEVVARFDDSPSREPATAQRTEE